MTTRRTVLLLGLLASTGCTAPPDDPGETRIAPRLAFRLPTPASLGYRVSAHQLITGHFGGETYVFETEIAISPAAVDLVGLDAFGRRALTLRWSGSVLDATSAPWLPATIRPANSLADLALTSWPEPALADALAGSDAELVAAPMRRAVRHDGGEIIVIDYDGAGARRWNGRIRYRNLGFGYDLEIQSTASDE